jgi:hypothetical protein
MTRTSNYYWFFQHWGSWIVMTSKCVLQLGAFGDDNRAGIDRTLHRISCMRNRDGRIIGLTCRAGRAVPGSASMAADLIASGRSILFMVRCLPRCSLPECIQCLFCLCRDGTETQRPCKSKSKTVRCTGQKQVQ